MRSLFLAIAILAFSLFSSAVSAVALRASATMPSAPAGITVDGQAAPAVPSIQGVFGSPVTLATHAQLAGYGYSFGPPDGQFGAIASGNGSYTFFGAAGTTAACAGTPNVTGGAFTFTGTLDQVTSGNGCRALFGPGSGPAGWIFDRDYAGGGIVVPFAGGGASGYLMVFHGELHWSNPATSDHKCNNVACFYSSLGLAVSTDAGKTFTVAGQILQPSQPLSVFTASNTNMPIGYGSLIVADANGQHLDNPPGDPSSAYFYVFYPDRSPTAPGACARGECLGVARASYTDVVAAALSGDPDQVATVFHKYDGATPDPWTEPATSDTPDESGTAGTYAPLWSDEPVAAGTGVIGGPEVLYDGSLGVYLAAYGSTAGIKVRASSDLIHWSEPIGAPYAEAGRTLYEPTLLGETGDPTVGGPAPRVAFTSFPAGAFPNWSNSVLESVPLTLSALPAAASTP
jgi:hypothetical protein